MSFQPTNDEIDLEDTEDTVENIVLSRLNSIKARGRMSSVKSAGIEPDTQTLTFKHTTKAQERTRKRQQPIKLEPLPVLKVYQDHQQPEYIYEQNRSQLRTRGILKRSPSSAERKSIKSPTSFAEPQDDVKKKQIRRSSEEAFAPSPQKQPRTGIGRRGLFGSRSSTYPTYIFQDPEEVIKANIRDPLQIIKIIRENENLGFLYMIPAVPKSSIEYNTYNLKVVAYENINKNDYYTISQKAVTHVYNDEIEFIEIDRWEQEYLYHRELIKIPIFSLFRKWKAFSVWRKNVRSTKINECRKSLQKDLFIVHPYLRPALLKINELCYQLSFMGLYYIEKCHTYTLQEFKAAQVARLQEVTERLEEFRNEAKEVVRKACRFALRAAGFVPDDCAFEPTESMKGMDPGYIRNVCFLKYQFFCILLVLGLNNDPFSVLSNCFLDCISDSVDNFQNTVLSVPNLVPDTYFDAFTSPYINNKLEEKTCGPGPSLSSVFDDDKNYHIVVYQIKETVHAAFESAYLYAATFEKIHLFFKENESLDLQALKLQEPDVKYFSDQLEKYHKQHKDALALKPTRNVGLLLIDTKLLKEKLIPSPLRCLEVLNFMLPRLSKKKVDAIISEAQDAEYKLEFVPSTTIEYVNSLVFLDEIQERIESLEDEGNVVVQMYKLIEQYQIATPPEDFAVFATMKPSIIAVRNAIDRAVGDRETSIKQFSLHLGRDLEDLNEEVNEIKLQAQDPQILDINTDQEKIKNILSDLQSVLDDLQKRAFQYKSYQKNFKVEVSKFEALEEVSAELKLKQLLWESYSEWDKLQQEWLKSKFDSLDPEFLNSQVSKYAKIVNQLEKGLPPNNVVPQIKSKVEKMKEKLPVIIDLRNPTLKPRHWTAIEQTVDASLVDTEIPLTLERLSELHVFDFGQEIQDISGQASGEASLEIILKKVEDSWKTTEFVVLPHRDTKDVFILGGTDDIQVLLDDSTINIATIASSRYVGPLKARVDDWQKQLALFNQTLVILTISQIMWCRDLTECLETEDSNHIEALEAFETVNFERLNALATVVRGSLPKLHRNIITALITIDVHARDIVTELVNMKVDKVESFDWQRQLRYYWDVDIDNCVARMALSQYTYGYEYLGACPRLVITPLTDRCYLCLMGALQLDLGGAPAGPAGTGKTETTKDLAKALAIQCVVFNCSDGLDYKMMGRFFSGLAQSGAWCCFDEFNRIDIEVLSVIAQQLITIRNAKAAKLSRFMFEGREIKLVMTCAAFITMNPGYAGRTELPDNLKALFRPMAMMVPNYALIAEVILYSEGFESSKTLARKMTQMYKLCSEQLSQQDHYDFGMRAVKSVLVMAGSLKRENPDLSEDVVLIRALRDSNLPKFLTDDAILFSGIISDLFPGVQIPEHDYGILQSTIVDVMNGKNLQPEICMVEKVIQFYETMLVRHGVMLVGPTGGGKTTVYQILAETLGNLRKLDLGNPFYQAVKTYVLNPKSIMMGELYGEVNNITLEWKDGLMALSVRAAVNDTSEDHKWIISDGPVDALWIENLNTVLDDNKMLCLANSERIKLTPQIHMLFEVNV
ncbi:Hypothetical predicted protein [Marmota monax]|uniref:AAA+ ATPase domain-containing protein n=1 Tax=Marmota monax TaxID=9995 RepID=A0A5E4AW94_MARMO|nr:Hypothetical predicted protein [Marmota monax]